MGNPDYFSDPGALFERMAKIERSGTPYAIATVVASAGSSPRTAGARMLVFEDGSIEDTVGGGGLEKLVIADAVAAIGAGKPLLKEYKLAPKSAGGIGAACGGDMTIFIEPRTGAARLVIVGGGHVGLALAKGARGIGMAVTVVDHRPEFSDPARFPQGVRCATLHPGSVEAAALAQKGGFVVIMTHGHEHDMEALAAFLRTEASYIGMIGSRRKVKAIMDSLEKEGFSREKLDSVFSPIGLDIGAETPEEIALSILAEIVHFMRKGGASVASLCRKPGVEDARAGRFDPRGNGPDRGGEARAR